MDPRSDVEPGPRPEPEPEPGKLEEGVPRPTASVAASEGAPSEAIPGGAATKNELLVDGEPLEFALGDRADSAPELRFRGGAVATQPPLADAELTNADELAGAVALVHRGECSFAEKAERAAAAAMMTGLKRA